MTPCALCTRPNRYGTHCRGGDTAISWCLYRARLRLGMPKGLCAAWRQRDIERMTAARGQG